MAEKLKDFNESIVTPAGTAQYPSLNKPDTRFDEAGTYKVNLIVPQEEAEELINKIEALAEKKKQQLEEELTPAKFKKATQVIRLPYEAEEDEEGEETGNIVFKFKCKASFISKKDAQVVDIKLPLVDSKKTPVTSNIGGGSKLKVAAELRTYYVPSLGMGVSTRLKAVQVLELVEFGNAANMFDEEDGFTAVSEDDVANDFDDESSAVDGSEL